MDRLIFISWAGEQSRELAEALHDRIPNVIQRVKPWMTTQDMWTGISWVFEIKRRLREARVILICVTRCNRNAPWLNFEAGASWLSNDTLICPYLFDLEASDLELPLAQFNAAKADKDDTRKLLLSINKTLGQEALPPKAFEAAFEKWWPKLDDRLKKIRAAGPSVVDKRKENRIHPTLI